MSSRLPDTTARRAHENIGVLLREPFLALTEHVHERLSAAGFPEIRPAHGTVFQFLDDEGTRVSLLAERAQMTKQSMAELVAHLETHGYVKRIPDPSDRRAKLVKATRRGRASYPVALAAIRDTEAGWTERLGETKMRRLRQLLEELNAGL